MGAESTRPIGHPLIVHLGTEVDPVDGWVADLPAPAEALARAFWPGPLTMLLPRGPRIPDAVTGGRPMVGIRVPDHALALELLDRFGSGVAAPSANRFGRVSPTTADHVRAELGEAVDLVLDGGPSAVGVESTIVDLGGDEPLILRPGGVPAEALAEVLGRSVGRGGGPARAPGMLASHYAPAVPLDLVDETAVVGLGPGTVVVGPARLAVPDGVVHIVTPDDAAGYARGLYRRLREAERSGAARIAATRPPAATGLWAAVEDRLQRAAGRG